MTLRPDGPNQGIRFNRKDVGAGGALVEAHWYNVVDTDLCTILGNRQGVTVSTVEHLLAALRMVGIDNLLIDLEGPEVPIMDGSAQPFVSVLSRIGTVRQPAGRFALEVLKPVSVHEGGKFARLAPAPRFRARVLVDFPGFGRQFGDFEPELGDFAETIAPARTFGFHPQIEALRARGLARGGNLRNAVVLDGARVLNEEGLRFPDELVRHKMLDAIGDLALVGAPIQGRYVGYKPGHRLNQMLLSRLFSDKDAWCYRPLVQPGDLAGGLQLAPEQRLRG